MATTAEALRTQDVLAKKEIEELRKKLEDERENIMQLYSHDLKAGQESRFEKSDDIVDQANSAYNRELMFSLSNAESKQIREIEAALARLEDGTYGICQHSGKPIGLPRLKAVPWTRYSIEFQELAELGMLDD